MTWNWQLPDWPNFKYDALALSTLEKGVFLSLRVEKWLF